MENSGGSCDYYRVPIANPTTSSQAPYTAECNDIIEALDLSYAEANILKEVWRTAAARTLGKTKAGNSIKRATEKICFFAERYRILNNNLNPKEEINEYKNTQLSTRPALTRTTCKR